METEKSIKKSKEGREKKTFYTNHVCKERGEREEKLDLDQSAERLFLTVKRRSSKQMLMRKTSAQVSHL